MATLPRLVLDTNVCLDLFVFGDASCAVLRNALHAGAVQAVTDAACRGEWLAVLDYPQLALDAARRAAAVAAYDQHLQAWPDAERWREVPESLPSLRRKLGSGDSADAPGNETEWPGHARAPATESLSLRERVAAAGRGFGQSETLQSIRTLSPGPSPGGKGEQADGAAATEDLRLAAPGIPKLPRCGDPDDQKFLELAHACAARWLLSRDRELLKLARRTRRDHGFDILTPQAWAQAYPAGVASAKPV